MHAVLRKVFFFLLELCVVLILGLTIALFWASYYIDTDDFRTAFTKTLGDFIKRPVHLEGDLNIALWPDLAFEIEGLSVEGSPEFGSGTVARFGTVHILIEVIPLFAKQIEIESVVVDGMNGVVIYDESGRMNWETLLDSMQSGGASDGAFVLEEWTISVNAVDIADAEILLKDESTKEEYRLSGIGLRTGTIQLGEDLPFSIQSDFSWGEGKIFFDSTIKGLVHFDEDGFGASLKDATVYASVYGDFLPDGAQPGELAASLDMDWENRTVGMRDLQVSFLDLRAEGNLSSGDLRKGFEASGHITLHPFVPAELIANHAPDMPVGKVPGLRSSALSSFVHVTDKGILFKDLLFTLDDITVRGNLGITGYAKPEFDFTLRGDSIDLDRYLPLFVTGTPFIWEDFHLGFFRKFSGKGRVRADGLNILGTNFSDIRLNVAAKNSTISFVAETARHGLTELGGTLDVAIGGGGVPTLALKTKLNARSPESGFPLFQQNLFKVGGDGRLVLEAEIPAVNCPPKERAITILHQLTAQVGLSLGRGVSCVKNNDQDFELEYGSAEASLEVAPAKGSSESVWNSLLTGSIRTQGGTDVQMVSLIAQGPLSLWVDDGHVKTSGIAVNGHLTSSMLPNEARRVTANGSVTFDSREGTAGIVNGFVRAFETTIKGSAKLTGLGKDLKGEGALSIPGANPRRIVYLVAGKALRTKDVKALTNATVDTQYSFDEKGFVLNSLKGELDGMPVAGHVTGVGFKNPMLAFSLTAGKFDLDRYLPPPRQPDERTGKVPQAGPVDLPLKFLRFLRLNGKASFEEFTLVDVRATDLIGRIRADKGNIHISKVTGQIHGGSLAGGWTGKVGETSLSTHLGLDIKGMQAGPLMQEMAGRDYLRGKTNLDIDLVSQGASDDDILSNLGGIIRAKVSDGSFKFSGYDQKSEQMSAIREPASRDTELRAKSRTSFQRAEAQLSASKGVFSVKKWRVEAPPVLQAYGKGRFSLPDNTINLSIRNDFVAIPSVTIVLKGKLTDPEVSIPTGKIVHDTVYNILSIPEKSFKFLRDLF